MNTAYIKAISYALPRRVVTNEELVAEFPEWTVEKISDKLGIDCRHVVDSQETAADIAVAAAEQLFKEYADIDRNSIDFVILCTQSPDYHLPTTACLIQERLGLPVNIGAFDYNLGCSGYVYGLAIAKGLVVGGIARNVLLLTSETYTKYIHPKDKGNRTLFGDGASATVVSLSGFAEIGNFSLGTDGRGANNLMVKSGGMRFRQYCDDLTVDEEGHIMSSDYLYMNGAEILSFTLEAVPALVKDTLLKNSLEQKDIDLFVFHQANKYIMNFIRKKIKIESNRFYYCLRNTGNTVSSTIPIALCEAMKDGVLKGKVLLAGFGVGYSWGGTVLTFKES